MTDDKLYTSLSANTIMAILTNHVQQTRLITSSTDRLYSLDSEDDFRSGCWNVSHKQQFFSELHLPGRSHYRNYWYSWVQTIYYEWALSEQCMSTEISELTCEMCINCIGESLDLPLDLSWGHLSQYSFTLFYFIKIFKSHCRSFGKVNKREKGELHYSVQRGTIEQREQVCLDSQNQTMQSYSQYSYFPHRLYLTFTSN